MKPGRIHWGGDSPGPIYQGEFDQVQIHRGAFHIKCITRNNFEEMGIGMAYLHVFFIAMHGTDAAVGMYVEPFQTNLLELFCENSSWL